MAFARWATCAARSSGRGRHRARGRAHGRRAINRCGASLDSPTVSTPIVALDVPTLARAREIVSALGTSCAWYKVGLQLLTAEGPRVVAWLREQGKHVFLDLKLHDIPTTVRGAAASATTHGASLLTVHASGGVAMLAAAGEGAGVQDGSGCGILAVTVLTSLTAEQLGEGWGRPIGSIEAEVLRLAGAARAAGTHGIVCSGCEAGAVTSAHGSALRVLVPGVRAGGDPVGDQARVATPEEAARAGAAYVVLGRMVTAAANPVAAFDAAARALAG